MSFNWFKSTIGEGDKVILLMKNKSLFAIDVLPEIKNKRGVAVENVFQTTSGALKVKDLIGKIYGSRVELTRGWAHVLHPTPEFWTQALPHRTQIIYTPDISMIILQLDLAPGSVVVEAGTGSGSLSHAFIRRIKPTGHLHTFDFHEHRTNVAKEEFKSHGFSDFVTAQHRDVCADGFGDEVNGKADAVFLDLPHPWLGIPHAVKAIKSSGGRFCSFSPCIEQVQKSCLSLKEHGFHDINTIEVLQTEYNVEQRVLLSRDLDFLQTEKSNEDADKTPVRKTNYIVASTPEAQPGHTGFLTFATLPPVWARDNQEDDASQEDNESADAVQDEKKS